MAVTQGVDVRPARAGLARRWALARGRVGDSSAEVFLSLTVVAVGIGLLCGLMPHQIPTGVFAPLLVVAGLLLSPRRIAVLVAIAALAVAWTLVATGFALHASTNALVLAALVPVVVVVAMSRARTRPVALQGDAMLLDLRDQLARSGEIRHVPSGWRVQSALRSANGEAFSGDFLVSSTTESGRRLEVALVDVSGKGREAGTSASLLSGAFAGMLGCRPAAGFLEAANAYVLRQDWHERFATVVHVSLDYETGEYDVGRAGHPPAVHYRAGTGTWTVLVDGRGPLLGVLDGPTYPLVRGRLAPGDALLVYTDGVIESRGHGIEDGIDRMLGAATRAMVAGGHALAADVCEAARSGLTDDRAVFAVIRA